MDISIAIVVITYNRKQSLCRLLKSLDNAYYQKETPLYISIDKGDNQDVVDCAKTFVWKHGKKEVIEHEINLGLRKHILSCGEYLNQHDAIIVLEDDLIVSDYFYEYALRTVKKYRNDKRIAGISLYGFQTVYHNFKPFSPLQSNFDVFFMQNAQSWGEIWMRDQWNDFKKWYDNNDNDFKEQPHLPHSICSWKKSSWLKYHTKYCIENDKYFVYPYISFSSNVGESGTHASFSSPLFIVPLRKSMITDFKLPTFDESNLKYDSFFENEQIYTCLNIQKADLCLDLNGLKGNREKKRYWLTTEVAKFKVVRSFGLCLRPLEENVLSGVKGNDIFLYDTTIISKPPTVNLRKVFYYMNGYDIAHVHNTIMEMGIGNYIRLMCRIIQSKLK